MMLPHPTPTPFNVYNVTSFYYFLVDISGFAQRKYELQIIAAIMSTESV